VKTHDSDRARGAAPAAIPVTGQRAALRRALRPTQAVPADPGRPLSPQERAPFEAGLGKDLSAVRLHAGAEAASLAETLEASAYSVGEHVVLGAGAPGPETPAGRRLLAHELAHVAQPVAGDAGHGVSQPGDASEREAQQAADAVVRGERARVATAGAPIQRQPAPGAGAPESAGDTLLENASPFLAAALGSTTLDNFDTGKSDLKPEHKKNLASTAHNIQVLMRKYGNSTVAIVGYADTVGKDENNLALGQARAGAVKQALVDLGLPESILSTDSKGEGAPQAVKTKDKVPNAKNRRVEVLFRPEASPVGSVLPPVQPAPPATAPPADPPAKKPIDFTYHPKIDPPDPTHLPPDFYKPIPPLPKGLGPKSVLDVLGEKVLDPVIDKVAGGLSKETRDKIKQAARDGVATGLSKGARAAAEAAGVKDSNALDAIEKAVDAAIQEKGKSQPQSQP
jgi:outer membrane protein OmpA-like peptidoglycan-associated protein